jgi:acyl-coenzyme A thioesterase PaaI-like protein
MGLKASFYETETGEVIAVCTPCAGHQSYPQRLHGGVSSALLDETIGRAICVRYGDMVWGVTLELQLKYRKPVPYDVPVKVVGRTTSDRGRLFEGSGEIVLPGGEVAVEARGLYMKQTIEKIAGSDFTDSQWGLSFDGHVPEIIEL